MLDGLPKLMALMNASAYLAQLRLMCAMVNHAWIPQWKKQDINAFVPTTQ
jgi:hypothetical protein